MEYSLPNPGTTIGDAGPYAVGGAAAPGWWDKWGVEARASGRLTQTAFANIGVFNAVDDQLECTEAADTTSIDVDEGAAMVDGIFYWNDTDPVNVPIPAAGAGDDRIDLVVVRKNYSAVATYTPGGGAPAVAPRETRITVIRGVEAVGPVAPTMTQDVTRATFWDIPLCSVQVDDAGALTLLTDLREYVDAVVWRRQGGSATEWGNTGTTNFIPGDGFIQTGRIGWTGGAVTEAVVTVTFPVPYASDPIIIATASQIGASVIAVMIGAIQGGGAGADLRWESVDGVTTYTAVPINWWAIGEI